MCSIDWNAYDFDSEGKKKNANQLVNEVKKSVGTQEKVVILMHDTYGKEQTANALPQIIEYLKRYSTENNLEFYLLTGEGPDGRILSIENQYKLFTNAKIVVGPHGGVMNNLIFLDPAKKPKVIEFCPGGESKSFSRLFGGAIDVFAEYHQIPYILPTEVQEQIADEPNEALRMVKVISMLQKIDCIIDVSELKKILANL